jgi:hypothetical protein
MPELTRFNSGQHADDLLEAQTRGILSSLYGKQRWGGNGQRPGHPPCLNACVAAECPAGHKGQRRWQRLDQYRNSEAPRLLDDLFSLN